MVAIRGVCGDMTGEVDLTGGGNVCMIGASPWLESRRAGADCKSQRRGDESCQMHLVCFDSTVMKVVAR